MSNCLSCGKELVHIEGRKKKKYCDATCKASHFNKTRPKERKYVKIDTFKALMDKMLLLEQKLINEAKNTEIGKQAMELAKKDMSTFKVNNISADGTKEVYTDAAGKIAQYEAEIAKLGVGENATKMKNFYIRKIKELKRTNH